MFNYGGIRVKISPGLVTIASAFELMPFENELVVAELTAEKVVDLVSYFMKNKEAYPLSKQLQLVMSKAYYSLKIN